MTGPIERELRAQRDFLARSYVEWVQHYPADPFTSCLLVRTHDGSDWLADHLTALPFNWNDFEATSKAEVVAKLDEAIAAAREAGR